MIFLYVSAKRFSRHHHFRGSWSPQLYNLSRRSGPAKVFGKFTELERHHARDTHWAKIFKKVHFSIYKKWLHAHDFPKIILKMEMNWGIQLILVFLVIHIVSLWSTFHSTGPGYIVNISWYILESIFTKKRGLINKKLQIFLLALLPFSYLIPFLNNISIF